MNRFVALLRKLASCTLAIFRTSSAERDLDEELQTHLDLAIEENLRNGMTAETVRSPALRAFGGITQTKESSRYLHFCLRPGIYSIVSYTVSQRTKEFGVRMALGAQRASVVRLFLQASLLTVTIGAVIGIVLARHHPRPLMLAEVSALLPAVTAFACLYPTWRAASI
jgi:hypothetical protein